MSGDDLSIEEFPVMETGAIERLKEWGGPPLARKMMEIFLESSGERMDQMKEGLSTKTGETAVRGAHSLKSSAGNVGAVRLQRLAEKAESLAEDEDLNELERLLPVLEKAYDDACEALRKLLEGMEE